MHEEGPPSGEPGPESTPSPDALAVELQQLRNRHQRITGGPPLSYREIRDRTKAGFAHTTIGNYLTGATIPDAAMLDVFDAPEETRPRLATLRDLLADQRQPRPPTKSAPGEKPGPGSAAELSQTSRDLAVSHEAAKQAEPRRSRWLFTAIVGAVVVVAGVIGAIVLPSVMSASSPTELQIRMPPTSRAWADSDLDCGAKTLSHNTFPTDYVGQVYAQFSVSANTMSTVTVTLDWGGYVWSQPVRVHPGQLSTGEGGTVVSFYKRAVDPLGTPSPRLTVTSDTPTCVVFGTARTDPQPAPYEFLEATEWTPIRR